MPTATIEDRKIVVNIATSADGYVARPDGDLEWLTSRPAPKGFHGMGKFVQSIDAKVLGRKTYDVSCRRHLGGVALRCHPPTLRLGTQDGRHRRILMVVIATIAGAWLYERDAPPDQ